MTATPPTDEERVALIRSQTLAVMQEVTRTPKPSYSINGQSVSWADYLSQLRDTVAWCDQQLAATPVEIVSRACT